MCCRYYFDNDTIADIERITGNKIDSSTLGGNTPGGNTVDGDTLSGDTLSGDTPGGNICGDAYPVGNTISRNIYGDIHPADQALVILGAGKGIGLAAESMRWGFPGGSDKKQLMINARAESALEKRAFCESVLHRRCIIPAKHFYEWDTRKNKVTFTWDESTSLYMAGFWNISGSERRFIILTTEANEPMRRVHDRMPLILPEKQIMDWIHEDSMVKDFLAQPSPMLSGYQEYEQLSLQLW